MHEASDICSSLLQQCQNNLSAKQFYLAKHKVSHLLKKKIKVDQSRFGISPQQMEENAKVIDKLRKKFHKKSKEVTIKKTTLGEDMLTFTPQQYARLQLIDEYNQRGLEYKQNLDDHPLQGQKKSAVDRLKQLAKLDDVIEEVQNNLEWGSPIPQANSSNLLRTSSQKKLGFQKRMSPRYSSNSLLNWKIEQLPLDSQESFKAGKSLNKYYFSKLNKQTVGRKQFLFTKYDSNNKSEVMSLNEKIQFIRVQAEKRTANLCRNKSPFMTNIRKQAIFGCQMLRQAKKILTTDQLNELQLSVLTSEDKNQVRSEERESRKEKKSKQNCEAQEILQKNYCRIKAERRRIIEKMVC